MNRSIILLFTLCITLTFGAATAFGFGNIGDQVNDNCSSAPYAAGDCTLCHTGNFSESTPAKDAAGAGDWCFFCPNDVNCQPTPSCTDVDGDNFALEGGDCGPIDCDDNDAASFPGATEICGDGIDQDCSGSDLACPPTACTDADGDGFAVDGGDCGPLDCDDADPAINPGAAEHCTDSIDNNCDGLIDGQDAETCPPAPACIDADGDGFFAQDGCNTAVDCNDLDATVFPGAAEVCGDVTDNDCDGQVDEGCGMGDDGRALYENYCASCHGDLPRSNVCGEDAREITEAILEDEGGMGFLSSLTDEQIAAIAAELEDCDDDDDKDKKKKKKDKKKKKKDKKKKKHNHEHDKGDGDHADD